jgi:D-amino peptidase
LVRHELVQDPRITYHHRSVEPQEGKLRWMPGLDETVGGLMLPGHHAKAGTERAFLPHTSSRDWADFQINGLSVGEIGIQACYAGHWNIPLILVQGDEAGCEEAQQQFPGVVTAAVKRFKTPELATGLDPESAQRETAKKVAEAIEKLRSGKLRPFKTSLPMTVTIRMYTAESAARAATRPGVQRLDVNTVESRVARQCDVMKWIQGLGPDITPGSR